MSISGAVRAGRAYVEITLTGLAGFRSNIKKASNSLRVFGFAAQGAGRALTAMGIGIAGPIAYAIKAASDMEESVNKLNLVFGGNADEVKAWGISLADSVGRSRQEIIESLAQMQMMFKGAGFEPEESTDLSKSLVEAGIDLASVVNMDDADVLRDFKRALSDSAEAIDKLGFSAKDRALKNELEGMGIAMKDATEKQRKLARAQLLLKGSGFAFGDALNTADKFAGTLKRVQGTMKNLAGEVGAVLLPAVTSMMSKFAQATKQVTTFIGNNKTIITIIASLGAAMVAGGAALLAIGMFAQVAAFALSMFGVVFSGVISIMLFMISPIGLILAGITALTVAFFKFTSAGGKAFDWLKAKFQDLIDYWKPAMQGMTDAISAGDFELAIKIFWLQIKDVWFSFIDKLTEKFMKFVNDIKRGWHGAADVMSEAALQIGRLVTPDSYGQFWDAADQNLMDEYERKLGNLSAAEQKAHDEKMARRKELKKALEEAIALAAKEAAIAKEKKKREPKVPPPPGEEEGGGPGKGGKGKAIGTFNAAVVGLLNVANTPELIELKKIVKNTKPKKSAGDLNLDWQY